MNLLTLNQAKMLKSTGLGYLSAILNLQPAYKHNGVNTCPASTKGCRATCLQFVGRNGFDSAKIARVRRTHLLIDNEMEFLTLLAADIFTLVRKAKREGLEPSVRLNGLSDIDWENRKLAGKTIFEMFPHVQFIDYTKRLDRLEACKSIKNYHLTYSVNENTPPGMVSEYFANGYNVAMVFDTPKGKDLPRTVMIDAQMRHVIDGDESDLRHLDKRGSVVGLRYKPALLTDHKKHANVDSAVKSGFVILGQ